MHFSQGHRHEVKNACVNAKHSTKGGVSSLGSSIHLKRPHQFTLLSGAKKFKPSGGVHTWDKQQPIGLSDQDIRLTIAMLVLLKLQRMSASKARIPLLPHVRC